MTIPEEGEISMQFVKTADLKPGMRLAKPIYNRMGVLLYERDTRLTIQGINSIENFGLIGIFILEPAEPLPRFRGKIWSLNSSRPSTCSS